MKTKNDLILRRSFSSGSKNLMWAVMAVTLIFLSSCDKPRQEELYSGKGKIVYVESNDYHDNQNAVLAYMNNGDGMLMQIPGSPFYTHGAGLGNPEQILGPDDQETPLITTYDGKFLLAVNSGSHTIAVFSINPNGSLSAVPGSPFPSRGQNPVSLAMSGKYVYVANKS